MLKPLSKDTFREIKRSFGRFFSIFSIVFIGVAFFAGVKASAPDMKYTADNYYDDNNLMDIKILSNVGFTDDDVDKIQDISGVGGVFKTYSMDAITKKNSVQSVLKIHGLPIDNLKEDNVDYINRPVLMEGRLPNKTGECVIEKGKMGGSGFEIGDKVKLESGTNVDIINLLENNEYTVVGTVTTPYYLSFEKGSSSIGNGKISDFIMIPQSDFKLPVYTEVFITVDGAKEVNSYEDEYFDITDKVKTSIENLNKEEWHVLDRKSHFSYVDYGNAADKIDAIAKVFPLFFFIVAALVCLTTMTRMVDEERGNIGVLKALGYSKWKIASKYVIYAAIASLAGSILGLISGMIMFPIVIFGAWNTMYTIPGVQFQLQIPLALSSIFISVAITTLAAFIACYAELVATPSLLLRPKPPKNGKRIFLERFGFLWNRLTFTHKVTARNLFRYKKRFMMTVIGISGCTALLLAGFGIRDSIETVAKKQFEVIIKYDLQVALKNTTSSVDIEKLFNSLNQDSRIKNIMEITNLGGEAINNDKVKDINIVIPSDVKKYKEFYNLNSRGKNKEQILEDGGVIISEKLSSDLKLKIGDKLTINKGDKENKNVIISGITENYVGHYIFISPTYYKEVFGSEVEVNNFIMMDNNLDDNELRILESDLNSEEAVNSIYSYHSISENFNESISSLIYVIIVLIISAGALAFVVLYNLSNVNISERIREIATIKVLGFYDKEVSSYIYRENMILTVIGALVGCLLGIALHRFIMITLDLEDVMFGRNIKGISFVYGFILTISFSILVNIVMHNKLKKIPMVESLKSVE